MKRGDIKLHGRLRRACRAHQFSPGTEKCYAGWAERYIRFHKLRHPNIMGGPEIEQFVTRSLFAQAQLSGI